VIGINDRKDGPDSIYPRKVIGEFSEDETDCSKD